MTTHIHVYVPALRAGKTADRKGRDAGALMDFAKQAGNQERYQKAAEAKGLTAKANAHKTSATCYRKAGDLYAEIATQRRAGNAARADALLPQANDMRVKAERLAVSAESMRDARFDPTAYKNLGKRFAQEGKKEQQLVDYVKDIVQRNGDHGSLRSALLAATTAYQNAVFIKSGDWPRDAKAKDDRESDIKQVMEDIAHAKQMLAKTQEMITAAIKQGRPAGPNKKTAGIYEEKIKGLTAKLNTLKSQAQDDESEKWRRAGKAAENEGGWEAAARYMRSQGNSAQQIAWAKEGFEAARKANPGLKKSLRTA